MTLLLLNRAKLLLLPVCDRHLDIRYFHCLSRLRVFKASSESAPLAHSSMKPAPYAKDPYWITEVEVTIKKRPDCTTQTEVNCNN